MDNIEKITDASSMLGPGKHAYTPSYVMIRFTLCLPRFANRPNVNAVYCVTTVVV